MTRLTLTVMVLGLAVPALAAADTIRLKNGRVLEVEGWRDAGDSIEFAAGGGIVRISKAEVDKIDGKPRRGELKMYTSGVSSAEVAAAGSAAAASERAPMANQMKEVLGQGDGLFDQASLSSAEKVGAMRRLADRWREIAVPDSLRETHDRGRAAFQSAIDAFEGADRDPNAKLRIDKARDEIRSVLEEVKKAGAPS